MQGRQRIKDIVAALTDPNDVDYQLRTKTLYTTLTTLINQNYLRVVTWWNLMPPDDLLNKITLEEEKKLRGEMTTSAGLSTKTIKEAAAETEKRLKALKEDDKKIKSNVSEVDKKLKMKLAKARQQGRLDENGNIIRKQAKTREQRNLENKLRMRKTREKEKENN